MIQSDQHPRPEVARSAGRFSGATGAFRQTMWRWVRWADRHTPGGGRDLHDIVTGQRLLSLGITPRGLILRRPATMERAGMLALPGEPSLAAMLQPFEQRIRRQRVTLVAARAAPLAVLAALPFALAHLLLGPTVPAWTGLAIMILAALLATLACLFQRLEPIEVARLLDSRLGLHELLGTALEVESGQNPARMATSAVARAQHAQALRLLVNTSPSWVFPRLSISGEGRVLTALSALLVVMLLLAPHSNTTSVASGGAAAGSSHQGGTEGQTAITARRPPPNPFAHYASVLRAAAHSTPAMSRARPAPSGPAQLKVTSKSITSPAGAASAGGSAALSSGKAGARMAQAAGSSNVGKQPSLGTPPSSSGSGTAGPSGLRNTSGKGETSPTLAGNQQSNLNTSDNVGSAAGGSSGEDQGKSGSSTGGTRSGATGASGYPGGAANAGHNPGQQSSAGAGQNGSQPRGAPGSAGQGGQASGGKGGKGKAGAAGQGGQGQGQQGQGSGTASSPTGRGGRQGPGGPGSSSMGIGPQSSLARTMQGGGEGEMSQRMRGGGMNGLGSGQTNGSASAGAAGQPGGQGAPAQTANVKDLLPNLGNDNVSRQGVAFVINGQGSHGPTTDIGRANVFHSSDVAQGSLTASAPSIGSTAPGTYVAPDTSDVSPDQQGLVKAYFDPNSSPGQ